MYRSRDLPPLVNSSYLYVWWRSYNVRRGHHPRLSICIQRRKLFKKAAIQTRSPPPARKRLPKSVHLESVGAYQAGSTTRQLAKDYGASKTNFPAHPPLQGHHHWDGGVRIDVQPDILVYSGALQRGAPVVLEVKYKPAGPRPDRPDLEQALAYGGLLSRQTYCSRPAAR
jgi:hypothetical protein